VSSLETNVGYDFPSLTFKTDKIQTKSKQKPLNFQVEISRKFEEIRQESKKRRHESDLPLQNRWLRENPQKQISKHVSRVNVVDCRLFAVGSSDKS
jgi:hypothetical protein